MSNKTTKFFQGLGLTTFSLSVYNTIQGIKTRANAQEENVKFDELLTVVNKSSANIESGFKALKDKVDHLKGQPLSANQVEVLERSSKDLSKNINEYSEVSQKFSESTNLTVTEALERCALVKEKADKVTGSSKKTIEVLNSILEEISKGSGGKGSGGSNYVSGISDFLSTLTFEQTVAILNISGCFVIIMSLISLIIIFYGNILIDKLQLEKRFPRIAKIIQ